MATLTILGVYIQAAGLLFTQGATAYSDILLRIVALGFATAAIVNWVQEVSCVSCTFTFAVRSCLAITARHHVTLRSLTDEPRQSAYASA